MGVTPSEFVRQFLGSETSRSLQIADREPTISSFWHSCDIPKVIVAFWRHWRHHKGYCEDWESWQTIRDGGTWEQKWQLLKKFADVYGIPPINPKSRNARTEISEAIEKWQVGIANRAAITLDTEVRREAASMFIFAPLYVALNPYTDTEKIVRETRHILAKWRAQESIFVRRSPRARVKWHTDYVEAWCLRHVKGWKYKDIACKLFNRKEADRDYEKKARLYAYKGELLRRGQPDFIRGTIPPGFSPSHDAKAMKQLWADILKRRGVKRIK